MRRRLFAGVAALCEDGLKLTNCLFLRHPSWSSLGQRRRDHACRRTLGALVQQAADSPRRERGHRTCGSESLVNGVSNGIEMMDIKRLMLLTRIKNIEVEVQICDPSPSFKLTEALPVVLEA